MPELIPGPAELVEGVGPSEARSDDGNINFLDNGFGHDDSSSR